MLKFNKLRNIQYVPFICVAVIVLSGLCFADFATDLPEFEQALSDGDISVAMSKGKMIFDNIEMENYYNNPEFSAFKSRLVASEFLAKQMNDNLTAARKTAILNQVNSVKKQAISVAPAQTYYESAKNIFTKSISVSSISPEHKQFLQKYYNLRLRVLTSALAKTGQGLAIAEPSFKGTYDYVLVLPLLHCTEDSPIELDTLPAWMQNADNARALSESCLTHYGLPFQAMNIAKLISEQKKAKFQEYDYYITASKKCRDTLPSVAVDCIGKAIDLLGEDNKKIMQLKFDIVKIWLDSDNFALAAAHANELAEYAKGTDMYPDAVWNYYYALSRSNNIDAILVGIDSVLNDETCSSYHAKLAYIKWWSLRRSRADEEQILAIEHQLLEKYPDNPMVAPIMLSKATDFLARQDYRTALATLETIVEKYPRTKAAEQAKQIQDKLNKVIDGGGK